MVQPLFGPDEACVVRVALPIRVDELFDYAVPAKLASRAQVGCRVQVRFRERHLAGVIVSRGRSGGFRGPLLSIEKLLDPEPVLSPAMISILSEAAREVLCSIGIALAAALPAGSAPRSAKGFTITPRGREALRSGALFGEARRLLDALSARPSSLSALKRRGGESCGDALRDLERDGLVSRASVEQRPTARAATLRVAVLRAGVDAAAAAAGELARAPVQAALLRRLAQSGAVPVAALRREFRGAPSALRALARRGLIELGERAAPRDVLGHPLEPAGAVTLTAAQAEAVGPIAAAVRGRRPEIFLLHGVTGSGKTEIYLRAVAEALACGRQALVLVPEITLTHQILARLRGRFGDNLAVLHSGLRPGERLEQWQRLRGGATPIALGARSALFSPLENLGVIAIDEEHDPAYKNDEGFRYHARDFAARRAAAAGCPLLLGSATPSLETRYAVDRGTVRRLVLPSRIGNRPLPAVELVDLAVERELAPRGRKLILTRPLIHAMTETRRDGGQTLLLLNRRGFSTQVMCFDCGRAERCENCDIALVYHAGAQRLRCHYCDYSIAPREKCPACGAENPALLGVGTERLEEEVRSRFPGSRIARLDSDTAQHRGFAEGVLRRLRSGELDILIGTQMIAKGHDFPGVRLVGVVLADIGLHIPDFRAAERTFQLLTQVAGRAGRDREPGRVIIQTFMPGHYAIRPVTSHDYESFYAEELGHREALGYPPVGRLLHARVTAKKEGAAKAAADALALALCDQVGRDGIELLGPAPCPIARLRGRYRFQLVVKGGEREVLQRTAERLVRAAGALPGGVQAHVDANPMSML